MTAAQLAIPRLARKAMWVMKNRPHEFIAHLRTFISFKIAFWSRRYFFGKLPDSVKFGVNVRLQSNRSVRVERPNAFFSIGPHSIVYRGARFEAYGKGSISIGEMAVIGDARIVCRSRVQIGKRFLTSWNVFIQDFDPHPVVPELRAAEQTLVCRNFEPRLECDPAFPPQPNSKIEKDFSAAEIVIGDDVWMGANTTVLKGARIGNGSIVASGAVVVKGEYPDRAILAGNPAKVIKVLEQK